MTYEEFYGSAFPAMQETEQQLMTLIRQYPDTEPEHPKSVVYEKLIRSESSFSWSHIID